MHLSLQIFANSNEKSVRIVQVAMRFDSCSHPAQQLRSSVLCSSNYALLLSSSSSTHLSKNPNKSIVGFLTELNK